MEPEMERQSTVSWQSPSPDVNLVDDFHWGLLNKVVYTSAVDAE
jgi:hypothetical protein